MYGRPFNLDTGSKIKEKYKVEPETNKNEETQLTKENYHGNVEKSDCTTLTKELSSSGWMILLVADTSGMVAAFGTTCC